MSLSFAEGSEDTIMKKIKNVILLCILILQGTASYAGQQFSMAQWIWNDQSAKPNSWVNFETEFKTDSTQALTALIAVDSKYWLWLNDTLIVREGGVKRGPTPLDTYYDEVELKHHLKKGTNRLRILVWYWGVNGSSYKSSGKPGLLFELKNQSGQTVLGSDDSWISAKDTAFQETILPKFHNQNILSEWPIKYDNSRRNMAEFKRAAVVGELNGAPWNKLVRRPIPQWRDSDLNSYENNLDFPFSTTNKKSIRCRLPYNMQVYPYLEVTAPAGKEITIKTERDWKSNSYITSEGLQSFEVLSWSNGHYVDYEIPAGVEVHALKYRHTSYDSAFAGSFSSSDQELDTLWLKSARSVHLNMRDTYMDCPDRERSQWTHDATNSSEFTYYALDRNADALTRKMLKEMIDWKTPKGILWGAVPTGRFLDSYREFATSPLIGISVGLHEYYMQTADRSLVNYSYPAIKHLLLNIWKMESNGLVKHRGPWKTIWKAGTQNWNDWGEGKQDWYVIENCWYYLALKRAKLYAEVSGNQQDLGKYDVRIQSIEQAFDKMFWKKSGYCSAKMKGKFDDRANALAVYVGLAAPDKWDQIAGTLKKTMNASIYFEKYVLESLFMMNKPELAMQRLKKRYHAEIKSSYSTMPEHFGKESNHAWGGAPLLIAGKYLAGIYPLTPGYGRIQIKPQLVDLDFLKTTVCTAKGDVDCEFKRDGDAISSKLSIPQNAVAQFTLPGANSANKVINKVIVNGVVKPLPDNESDYNVELPAGKWTIDVFYN